MKHISSAVIIEIFPRGDKILWIYRYGVATWEWDTYASGLMPIIWCINIGTILSSPNLWCDYVFLISWKSDWMPTCRCIRIWERRRLLHSFIKTTGPLLIVDKVVPTEIYTAHNLKKNRDSLLGFPWEHPSFKMGLVFPSVTNCPVASSARAQDIRICAYFSISFPEAAILGRYFIYDSYSQVIQDTQVGQDTEASQVPK